MRCFRPFGIPGVGRAGRFRLGLGRGHMEFNGWHRGAINFLNLFSGFCFLDFVLFLFFVGRILDFISKLKGGRKFQYWFLLRL